MLDQRTSFLVGNRSMFILGLILVLLILALTASLVGTVGDAGLFLATLVANCFAVLLLWPNSSLGRYFDKRLPAAWDKRLLAFGLFAAGAVTLFAKIAEDVTLHESSQLDRSVSLWVHRFDTPLLDKAMKAISLVGTFDIKTVAVVVVLMWCLRRKDVAALVGLLGVYVADEMVSHALKSFFERPRPTLFAEVPTLHSFSFPSGHSMAAVATYGMIAAVVIRLAPPLKKLAIGGTLTLAFLIGYSRIYLGVHWLTDVLAGYSAGASLLFVGILWLQAYDTPRVVAAPSSPSPAS